MLAIGPVGTSSFVVVSVICLLHLRDLETLKVFADLRVLESTKTWKRGEGVGEA